MPRRQNNWRKHRAKSERSEWGYTSQNFTKPRHPPGLRGKAIGLFYRDRQKSCVDFTITLNIPKFVTVRLLSNLKTIRVLARRHGIETCQNITKYKAKSTNLPSTSKDEPKQYDTDDDSNDDNVREPSLKHVKMEPDYEDSAKQIKLEPECDNESENKCDDNNMQEPIVEQIKTEPACIDKPGTSSMPDFIPIRTGEPVMTMGHRSEKRILNLRGAGDYKYGYNDIITGTFSEKLEESLAKGINVAKTNSDITNFSLALFQSQQNMILSSQYQKMMKFRETLPTYKKRGQLRDMIKNNQVVVISGETGCGKSTQVPQIILDDAIMDKRGGNVKILVTQPRRIAASSLAARVASERAEQLGKSVGYAVRLEKVEPMERGSIMFCTTGVLLVDLEINQGLTDYSHVILDEVHERDVHIDLAMCMLKQVLQKRKDLKLILMSATLDADKLCSFFNDCPMMHIEGLAYPVKDIYLEEVLKLTNFQFNDPAPKAKRFHGKKKDDRDISEKAIRFRASIGPWLESIKKTLTPGVYRTLQDPRVEELNIDLIYELVKYICRGPPGAILVFLPGIGEISKLVRKVNECRQDLGVQYEIYPLHSKLPSLEQHRIFERPPSHIRKIIVATNIAETSITIDDIVYVVDSGKIKYSGLNVEQQINTLRTEWVSQANMHQRRGRAGRCQPGVCYHLVTSHRAAALEPRLLPELQRSDLLEPVLSIKRLRLGRAADALQTVPDAPAQATIQRAVHHLQQIGALDPEETLTPLGWHLARLPVHPAAGKLLLFGALFGCLDRAASVAAVWSFKDPFMLVMEKEDQAKEAKRSLAQGEPSDHVAISEAVLEWENCPRAEKRTFAYQYFLSASTLELLSDMKRQLGDNLKQMGFLASGSIRSVWENRNADNLSLFKAVIAAALYPNIAAANWKGLHSRNPHKQVRVSPRSPDGAVNIHPSSVMHPPKRMGREAPVVDLCMNPGANWMVYWLKQRSSDLFLIDVTLVYTLPLLFFGELKVYEAPDDPDYYMVTITTYKVKIRKDAAELLFELREFLDEVLAAKIMVSSNHAVQHSEFEEQVLNAVIDVITAEDERAEYLEASESDASDTDFRYY